MKFKLLLVSFLISVMGWGQVTIASDGLNNATTLFTLAGATYYTGNSLGTESPASSPFASEGSHSLGVSNGTATLTSSAVDASSYTNVSMSFRLAAFSVNSSGNGVDVGDIVTVEVSPDGGASWYSTVRVLGASNARWAYTATGMATTGYDGNVTPVDFAPATGGLRTTDGYSTVTVSNLPSVSNLRFRITMVNNDANERWLIDDFKVQGTLSSPCVTPSAQPTALAFPTVGFDSASGSFTASSPASDGYLVVYSTSATLSANPVDGVSYVAGNALGGGVVVQSGASTTFNISGLSGSTTYYVFVFSLNSACTGGVKYLTTAPLTGNFITTTAPCLSDSFASVTFPPTGWLQTNVTRSTTAGDFNTGPAAATFGATTGSLTTSVIANPAQLKFYLGRTSNTTAKTLTVEVSTTSQAAGFTTVATFDHSNVPSGSYNQYTVDLSAYTSSSTVWIRFVKTSSTTSPWRLDDVEVYCGPPSASEIDITGNGISIADGDASPSAADSTDFGSVTVGNISTQTFTIHNTGTDPLSLTGTNPYIVISGANAADFSVSVVPTTPVAATGTTTFEITFQPSALGVRTATLSIANNDADENPYNFSIQGTGISCIPATTITAITPSTGPVGTVVTITGTGFTNASVVKFGAFTAAFTIVSNTVITATVPVGATSGDLTIEDTGACTQKFSAFTVISEDNSTCAPSATGITELFISQVTDASSGSLSYIEVFNATASTIDMTDYEILIRNNGSATGDDIALTGTLAPGESFTLATSVGTSCAVAGGDGTLADQNDVSSGVNNNDCIHLAKLGTIIDTWGVCNGTTWITSLGLGSAGYNFMRREDATPLPTTTFNAADWNIVDFNACNDDYSTIDTYDGIRNPPVSSSPTVNFDCANNSAQITVTGTEAVFGGAGLTYQWFYNQPGNAAWTMMVNAGVFSGVTTNTLNISNLSGLNGYQFYCQVMEDTATCYVASSATMVTLGASSTTWNGSAWDNGVPTLTSAATINGNYDTSVHGSFSCCSLVVNSTYTLEIKALGYVEIQSNLTVNGTVNVRDDGSLVQISDTGVNTGNINYERTTTGASLDYVYWSSPVSTVNTPGSGYIYRWDPVFANPNGGWGYWLLARNTPMAAGVGYIMRGVFSRTFTGVPRNGVIQPTIARGNYTGADFTGSNGAIITNKDDNWNLIGNPYPSAIRALDFLTLNTNIEGAVRIWTHGTTPSTSISNPIYDSYVYNYTVDDYIVYNGTGTVSGPAGFNGFIAGGQSFMVNMNDGPAASGTVTFNNSLRSKDHNNEQFYRQSSSGESRNPVGTEEKHRIWLDLANANNNSTRTLVGYVSNATYEKDRLYDAITNALGNGMAIYTLINNEKMAIQGRALPFDNHDKVPVGVKFPATGTYSIGLSALDGLFAANQEIYLEDRLLNVIHDLKANPYFFTTDVTGFVNNRFELRFTNATLGTSDVVSVVGGVTVYASDAIHVSSSLESIKDIVVFDVLGRRIAEKKSVGATSYALTTIRPTQSPLIVKVTLENGQVIDKKVIY